MSASKKGIGSANSASSPKGIIINKFFLIF